MTRTSDQDTAEAVLVRRAQSGDRAAFDELARRHRSALVAVAFLRTGHREEAEDLAQEVLATAWSKLTALHDARAFAGWLKIITVNLCHNWHRRRGQWPQSLDAMPESDTLQDHGLGPLEVIVAREKQRAWRQALLTLPEHNRIALLMHIWGDSSYEAIAAFLGVPLTTVEGRIHRAKMQLRRLLRDAAAELLDEPRRNWNDQANKEKPHEPVS